MTSHGEAETAAQGRTVFAKLHARLGDFWWYSLMLFCACRAADLLNAFVGLWLVPEYIAPSELGAVAPLASFANFLALPAAAFANTFRNEVSRLSIGREFGKLKTLMRGVFIATALFLFAAIVAAKFTMPLFLERIRIVEGSLGLVIIAASFVSAVAPVYTNTLQALKKFKAQSILSIAGAPVRLATMLAAMPFRALTGYFIGQASVPAFTIGASVLALRKELSVKAEPYWNRATLKKFSVLFALFATWGISGGVTSLVESTVIRQRLPELDSAGYYMATRFSEIACYLYAAVCFTFFPFAAELARDTKARARLTVRVTAVNFAFCAAVAAVFFFVSERLLALLPHGESYAAYWWAVPWLVGITWLSCIHGIYTTSEVAANRFSFLKWTLPLDFIYSGALLLITGHGYFDGTIPPSWTDFLARDNICTLESMLVAMTAVNVVKAAFSFAFIVAQSRSRQPSIDISGGAAP